ncbi:hypothetical protein HZF05_08845 [Sphingomonas sp. CGMCC 1.13654]|uniref:Uncharacterized protein n=1 Tax=Sphingomonas chungangi TaxID=2683589 RepID=A0A838L5A2_9SPHN|nr:hypothetical protein [Sphingomonas chungangi]MBA2934207.1 hypothetical protein [Sphingomonas chungangi]MVW57248.1 hypothetical protein [Sphingomonas chungangi]
MSISAAASPRPVSVSRSTPRHAGRGQPSDQDMHAMKDAFTLARKGEQPQGRLAVPTKGEGKAMPGEAGEKAEAAVDGLDQRQTVLRDDRDQDQGDAQGWAFGQALADAPMIVPNAPSPTVDASGFAQLLGQLWAQAKQKNEREVRVKFGPNAWPATGARMVMNAAGTLDIALQMDRGGPEDLSDLARRLGQSGIATGTLAAEFAPA